MGAPSTLVELERVAPSLLAEGLPGALAGELDDLLGLDFSGYPLAAVLVAAACHDVYRGDGRAEQLLGDAWTQLSDSSDPVTLALAANVRANVAFGKGDFAKAHWWWRRCQEGFEGDAGTLAPLRAAALAHLSMEAFRGGDLPDAIRRAEEAMRLVKQSGSLGHELVPLSYLAAYQIWTGEFTLCEALLDSADVVWDAVRHDAVRNDYPLLLSLRGSLCALRGAEADAEEAFARAMSAAEKLDTPWYAVMARTLRAESTAPWAGERGIDDARRARREAHQLGDGWWAGLALLAEGVAWRTADHSHSIDVLLEALEELANPLDRARAQLHLGETGLAAGDRRAEAWFREAFSVLDGAGARYWATRCAVGLARCAPTDCRWLTLVRLCDDNEPAFRRVLAVDGELIIDTGETPSVSLGGARVVLPTRHAEVLLYALARCGPDGVDGSVLSSWLWPEASESRRGPRLRTALWQARRALGSHGWRARRVGDRVLFETNGIDVIGEPCSSEAIAALLPMWNTASRRTRGTARRT
jgi:hypothetical protein